MKSIAIFTDLDGTLISHIDYSFGPVKPLFQHLKAAQVPIVLASSKTRGEIEVYRKRMQIEDPFIVENGGAIFIPRGYFTRSIPSAITKEDYECIQFGKPYSDLLVVFRALQKELKLNIIGFHQMDVTKIVELTGLSDEEARLSAQREYDEPFIVLEDASETSFSALIALARAHGCKIVKGGRFFHLAGSSSKGRAVRILKRLFRENRGIESFLGLGDSENDLTMLANVDVPILIQKPDGTYDPRILQKLPHVIKSPAPGPEGWLASVAEQIAQC